MKHVLTITISGPPKSGKTLMALLLKDLLDRRYEFRVDVSNDDASPRYIADIILNPDSFKVLEDLVSFVDIKQVATLPSKKGKPSKKKPVKK